MASRKQKKKNTGYKWWIIIAVSMLALVVVTWLWYKRQTLEKARFVKYPGFGIDIPEAYNIHGIDVSWYQSYIDWASVKKMKVQNIKIGFAFIKATEGVSSVDRQFNRNWRKAKQAGVARGAYHYFISNKSGKTQAKNFITSVKLEAGDLPPVLDIEHLHGTRPEQMRKEIQDWLDTVEEYYGVKPIIYTYVNFYAHNLNKRFDKYPLWAAHYKEKDRPKIDRPWIFWQHNERGRVNGIVTRVDFNVFNGDSTDFKNLLIK